jgi:hypothetical protein
VDRNGEDCMKRCTSVAGGGASTPEARLKPPARNCRFQVGPNFTAIKAGPCWPSSALTKHGSPRAAPRWGHRAGHRHLQRRLPTRRSMGNRGKPCLERPAHHRSCHATVDVPVSGGQPLCPCTASPSAFPRPCDHLHRHCEGSLLLIPKRVGASVRSAALARPSLTQDYVG